MNRTIVNLVGLSGTLLAVLLGWFLCFKKPFDRPEYSEIDTSESAFLIPLEGDTENQSSFQSVQLLDQKKVATKRIQIPHRWNQTGPMPAQGHWLPTVRLVKVDRKPVTREWTQSHKSGTSSKDEAIAAESRDSINFSIGISCTARIPEDLAALFLYNYPSKSMEEMLDMEVRARVQQVIAEESGKFDLDQLRGKKNEIMTAVKDDIIPFFKAKGIDITTVAMQGGISYENRDIQHAIDEAAKASQLKVVAEAKRESQEVENKTIKLAAEGKAQAARLESQARADADLARAEAEAKGRRMNSEAEAEGIRKIAEARAFEVQQMMEFSDVYVQLKSIEADNQRWKQWDGKYPTYYIQLGQDPRGGFFMPPPALPDSGRRTVLETRK